MFLTPKRLLNLLPLVCCLWLTGLPLASQAQFPPLPGATLGTFTTPGTGTGQGTGAAPVMGGTPGMGTAAADTPAFADPRTPAIESPAAPARAGQPVGADGKPLALGPDG